MFVQVMILQCGKRKKTRSSHNVNAVRCSTQADEGCVHFPFRGGIKEGKFFLLLNIAACYHDQSLRIENYIRIAGMIEGGKFSYFCMFLTANLNRVPICAVKYFFSGDLAN